MEDKKQLEELVEKVMYGLNLAIQKLIAKSIRDNEPLVVSENGKVKKIYPKKKLPDIIL